MQDNINMDLVTGYVEGGDGWNWLTIAILLLPIVIN